MCANCVWRDTDMLPQNNKYWCKTNEINEYNLILGISSIAYSIKNNVGW